jgi:hypothetical protein
MTIRKSLILTAAALLIALGLGAWWLNRTPTKPKPEVPPEERLAVLKCLLDLSDQPAVMQSVPFVERWMKADPDPEVRWKAIELRCVMAKRHENGVCPPSVAQALFDGDRSVRESVGSYSGLFKEVSPEATEILLTAAANREARVRLGAIGLLGPAAKHDDRARRAIHDAREDKDFNVRHNAECSWFELTGSLDDFVPYCLRVQAEYSNLPPCPPGSAEEAESEHALKQLMQAGTFELLQGKGEERTDEMAKLVLTHLRDNTPVIRQGAALFVSYLADEAINARLKSRGLLPTRPTHSTAAFRRASTAGEPKPSGAAQPYVPPKLITRLSESKVEETLRKLVDEDENQAVREAARAALDGWGAFQEK